MKKAPKTNISEIENSSVQSLETPIPATPFEVDTQTTAEAKSLPLFTYLKGRPKQYRFNGQTGRFNINGTEDVGKSLTFIPLAWRIFEAELFARNRRELWAELFFIDSSNCVSAIMFNNSSVSILYKLIETLFYSHKTLADVCLTVTSEVRQNSKIEGGGKYFVAQFEYTFASAVQVALFQAFAQENPVFRQDTITETEKISLFSPTYFQTLLLAA